MSDEIVRLGAAWHYRLERKLARSTFGEIWSATWLQTGQQVVVKRLDQTVTWAPEQEWVRLDSLRKEVQVYRSLGENLHLARHLHDGEVDGLPVIVLEMLDGDLMAWLEDTGLPLPPVLALELVRQVAAGLAQLHRNGRCHLDLKPGNFLYRAYGAGLPPVFKLADFGLALDCRTGPAEHNIPGSLGWMSPEQVFPAKFDQNDLPVYRSDVRADVYALGLLFFFLLTGEKTAFATATEQRLRDDPQAIYSLQQEAFIQPGLCAQDVERLSRTLMTNQEGNGKPDHALSDSGTWIPGCSGRLVGDGNFQAVLKPTRSVLSQHKSNAIINLLAQLLAKDPVCRPANANAVLVGLEQIRTCLDRK